MGPGSRRPFWPLVWRRRCWRPHCSEPSPKPVLAGSVVPATSVQPPAVPGAGTAYLGAFIDPNGASLSATDPTGGTASVQPQLSALPNFDDQEGRSPSMLSTLPELD